MKNRIGLLVLIIISLGLVITLGIVRKNAKEQQRKDADRILSLSNNWVTTTSKLDEQLQVNTLLEKDKNEQKQAFEKAIGDLTNKYTDVSTSLTRSEASLKAAQAEIAKRDTKIAELENQNQALDKQALDLSNAITNLTVQIAETQRKLAASEGDKVFLQGELKRLMAEKAELEKQFNDLAVLRAQVSKLKEELSIARRLDWIRRGLFASGDTKGAQALMQGLKEKPKAPPGTNYDLNVEVHSSGEAKITAPAGATNAAAK